jgi:hypothetical protein
MKNKSITFFEQVVFLALAVAIFYGCSKKSGDNSGPANAFKRYPYRNFHVSYDISGDARGSEDVYVADYGKFESEYSKTEMFTPRGVMPEDHTLITRISDVYEMDNMQKRFNHRHIDALDSVYHLDPKDMPNPEQYMESEMIKGFLKNTGQEMIAGKLATKWQPVDGSMSMWIWNGILLRKFAPNEGGPGITMMVKNFDSTWVVDTTKFMVPKDYKEGNLQPEEPDAPPEPN